MFKLEKYYKSVHLKTYLENFTVKNTPHSGRKYQVDEEKRMTFFNSFKTKFTKVTYFTKK